MNKTEKANSKLGRVNRQIKNSKIKIKLIISFIISPENKDSK